MQGGADGGIGAPAISKAMSETEKTTDPEPQPVNETTADESLDAMGDLPPVNPKVEPTPETADPDPEPDQGGPNGRPLDDHGREWNPDRDENPPAKKADGTWRRKRGLGARLWRQITKAKAEADDQAAETVAEEDAIIIPKTAREMVDQMASGAELSPAQIAKFRTTAHLNFVSLLLGSEWKATDDERDTMIKAQEMVYEIEGAPEISPREALNSARLAFLASRLANEKAMEQAEGIFGPVRKVARKAWVALNEEFGKRIGRAKATGGAPLNGFE